MKKFHKITALVLSMTISLIIVGCGGGSSSSTATTSTPTTSTTPSSSDTTTSSTIGQAKLSIHLTDAPAEFEAVYVTIAEVHVHRADTEDEDSNSDDSNDNDDGEWLVVATPNITYNLLELQNGITTFMGEELIPSGDYTQLRLVLGSTPDTEPNLLGNPHPEANYIILDDDLPYALKVPSNTVKYNHNFTLIDGSDVDMVIDFDAKKSIHPAGDKWILNPVLKVTTELQ